MWDVDLSTQSPECAEHRPTRTLSDYDAGCTPTGTISYLTQYLWMGWFLSPHTSAYWFGWPACRSKSDSHNIIRTWDPPKKIIKVLINVFFEYSICYRTLQIQDSKLVVLTLSTTEIQPGDEACASNKRSSITVPSNNGRLLNTQGKTPSWTASCPTWHTSAWRKQTDVICLDWIILNINISLTSKTFGDMQKTSIPHWGSFFHATISRCDRKLMREFLENWNIIGYETRYERIVVNISLRGCHQGSSEKWWPNPRTS